MSESEKQREELILSLIAKIKKVIVSAEKRYNEIPVKRSASRKSAWDSPAVRKAIKNIQGHELAGVVLHKLNYTEKDRENREMVSKVVQEFRDSGKTLII